MVRFPREDKQGREATRLDLSRPQSLDELKPSTFVSLGEVLARMVRSQEEMRRERAREG